jgi:broad specificity phosphatase PhoE
MGEIHLVRHGQALVGTTNYDQLSELGLEQARCLGRWLASARYRFDVAVTGTQRRHAQTAEACLGVTAAAPRTIADPGFNEYHRREMMARYDERLATPAGVRALTEVHPDPHRAYEQLFAAAFERWIGGRHDGDYRESFAAFRARCLGSLQRLVERADVGERIVVFTSGGPIAVIVQSLLGLRDDQVGALNLTIANASVTTLRVVAAEPSLLTWNSFQHLEEGGLVTFP